MGYRVEFQIPAPGYTVVINPAPRTFHFGMFTDPPRAPSVIDSRTDPPSSYPPLRVVCDRPLCETEWTLTTVIFSVVFSPLKLHPLSGNILIKYFASLLAHNIYRNVHLQLQIPLLQQHSYRHPIHTAANKKYSTYRQIIFRYRINILSAMLSWLKFSFKFVNFSRSNIRKQNVFVWTQCTK